MDKPILTATQLRELLDYDPETGIFRWKYTARNTVAGTVAGGLNKKLGYIQIGILGVKQYAHRLAWLYMYGEFPCGVIDHIDQNKTNNRISNLRDVSHAVNHQNIPNAPLPHNKSSGLLGASWHAQCQKWTAWIKVNGRRKYLGLFPTKEEAHRAYMDAKRLHHEGCTI